jgi:hypothetical protein
MTLLTDLQAAGLPVVSTNGEIQATFSRSLDDAEMEIYLNILFPNRQTQRLRKANAIGEAMLATELKTLTPAQAVQYIESNVTDLPSAKRVLKIMARILIALRDEAWPDLPER